MGIKTTASVLIHMVGDMIRHPLTASTVYVDSSGKVRVVREKKDKPAEHNANAVGKSKQAH